MVILGQHDVWQQLFCIQMCEHYQTPLKHRYTEAWVTEAKHGLGQAADTSKLILDLCLDF